jgi:hypothetical protein
MVWVMAWIMRESEVEPKVDGSRSPGRMLNRLSISDTKDDTEDCLDLAVSLAGDWVRALRMARGVAVPRVECPDVGLWLGVGGRFFKTEAGQAGGGMLP